MVGKYPALDDRITEMVSYMRRNGVKRLLMNENAFEIEFQGLPAKKAMPVWGVGRNNDTTSDETSYYSMNKGKDHVRT